MSMLQRTVLQVISKYHQIPDKLSYLAQGQKTGALFAYKFSNTGLTMGTEVVLLYYTFIRLTAVFCDKIRGPFVESRAKALSLTETALLSHHERCPFHWQTI